MIVVSDTSALTSLIQIQRLNILFRLYDSVVIPTAVRDELLNFHSTIPKEIRVAAVTEAASVARLSSELDLGEAEAIVLAREINADLILIDEAHGRQIAVAEGFKIIGTLGVLIQARKDRILEEPLAPILDELSSIDFFISEELREGVLRAVGEP